MRFAYLFVSVIVFSLNLSSQNLLEKKVILDKYVEDEKGRKMQSLVAVYKYKSQPFEDPINIGVDTKKEPSKFYAKLPIMTGVNDTNYAFIYFGALTSRKSLPGYAFAIIGNNKRDGKPTLIWIDKNHNLDLSDDGAPDSFFYFTENKDIVLRHPDFKKATYTLNISRFHFNFNARYISLIDDYYKVNSGSKQFAGSMYSFREQRINCIAGDFKNENDSFRIGVKDANCNGLYNDSEVDFILIGDYQVPELPDNVVPIQRKNGQTFFERKGRKYLVSHIDPFGEFITLMLDEKAKVKNALVIGKKIKKFKFQTTEKERKTISIKKFKKKPTYIFVWRFGQDDFDKDTTILRKIVKDYGDKINVVTLNYGETPKELRAFKRRSAINWMVGQSTIKINQKLFVETYPTGILTRKRLKVKQVSISPTDLLLLLQSNQL
jgi:hypothetical protein